MTPDKQKELYKKYPKIFAQRTLPPRETAMVWGIECSDGWYDIIDKLCESIQSYVDSSKIDQIEATQVKEKYGGLRFYVNYEDDYTAVIIRKAEDESIITCEWCGSKENVGQTNGWIITLCQKCAISNDKTDWKPYDEEND